MCRFNILNLKTGAITSMMAKSFLDYCDEAKELISITGREGISWFILVSKLQLSSSPSSPPSPLEIFLFNHLISKKYEVSDKFGQKIDNYDTITSNHYQNEEDVIIKAPLYEIYRHLGIKSNLEIPPDPGMLVLEKIAMSGANGLLITEISQYFDKKTSVYQIIDKLVTLGLVKKRMLKPITTTNNHGQNSRGKARVVIVHLTRYASLYDPLHDQMQFEVTEEECLDLQNSIINYLTERRIKSIPIFVLSSYLQIMTKFLTRKIQTCITQLKAKCRLSISSEKYQGKGPFTIVSCLDIGNEIIEEEEEKDDDDDDNSSLVPSNTIFNMTIYEQVIYRLNMFNGLTSRKIKQLVGLNRKKCYSIVTTLTKTLKYRHDTVQSGRQRLYLIYGNNPFGSHILFPSHKPESSLNTLPMIQSSAVMEENKQPAIVTNNSSKQVDLHTIRKNMVVNCLARTGGIIDSFTVVKEAEKCYKELNLSTQVDRKTVNRLMMKFTEDGVYEYLDSFDHPGFEKPPMKPHLIFRKDIPNLQESLERYICKFYFWCRAGKKGFFLDYFDDLPDEPNPSIDVEEFIESQMSEAVSEDATHKILFLEHESDIRSEFKIENLKGLKLNHEVGVLDESEIQSGAVSLERINNIVSLCPHYIASPLHDDVNATDMAIKKDNDQFFENLRHVYYQLLLFAQDNIADKQEIYCCRFLDTLLGYKIKSFLTVYGLCKEYLHDIDQRIHRVNLKKRFCPSDVDRVIAKSVQSGYSMSTLAFCQVCTPYYPLISSNYSSYLV